MNTYLSITTSTIFESRTDTYLRTTIVKAKAYYKHREKNNKNYYYFKISDEDYKKYYIDGKFTKKTDFGKGHILQNQADVKGILEYAETEDGTKYTVKSWTNPSMITVMYVSSKKEVNINFQEIYFNGFRFKK